MEAKVGGGEEEAGCKSIWGLLYVRRSQLLRIKEFFMAKLLIVDDEENIREFYKEELAEEGYDIILAANGKEAIHRIQKDMPDLVVLDIRMPEMDGIEALGKMIARYKDLPVILNTAYYSYRNDFRTWAAEGYIVKSADLSELKAKIREILEKRGKLP
jgi:DNA-binding response OmpR family regulator